MATLGWFQEYNPYTDKSPQNTDTKVDSQGLKTRNIHEPYYTYSKEMQFPRAKLAGVAYERSSGREYQCLKMCVGRCDAIFWMSPGRPQDQGTFSNNLVSGVWRQKRMQSSTYSVAASAPYAGIYTGLKGYVQRINENE